MYKDVVQIICCDTITLMKYLAYTLMFAGFLGIFGVANAQLQNPTGGATGVDVGINMAPETPKPNGAVYISLTSYATDLNSASITWKLNDKIQKSGVGEKSFSFVAPNLNVSATLEIIIETTGGETVDKTIQIKPTSVDLIWESDGFVPPFYKGKSLFSHQNKVTVTAMPHIASADGTEILARNLVYTWKKDGSVVSAVSGFGKNSYSFVSSIISRPVDIEVDVTTTDTSGNGYASISLTPNDPSVIFYRKDPVNGIEFQKALQNTVDLNGLKELTVVGMPLFFGTTNINGQELIYKWLVNGLPADNGSGQSTQVFRPQEGVSGTSNISLSIENQNKILQYASKSFNLTFGSNGN